MNQLYSNYAPASPDASPIDEIFEWRPARKLQLLEILSQIMFFADVSATKGFDRTPTKADLLRVERVKHSANWAHSTSQIRKATILSIRNDLAGMGLFRLVRSAAKWIGKDKNGKSRYYSDVTVLAGIDLVALAQLARRLMADLCDSIGWESVDRDHHWGRLASIVDRLTGGCSLFTLDDDYTRDEEENDRLKGERLMQAIAEMGNVKFAGFEFRELVSANLDRWVGPDWPDLLPY
jgi:hypothetical protein